MKKIAAAIVDASLVAELQKNSPAKQRKMWGYTTGRPAQFKSKITADLIINQSSRCAYCGTRLFEKSPSRDHIASKGSHPEFTFERLNLVLTCYFCNSEQKGEAETVLVKDSFYSNSQFRIIHPILDDPEQHIRFIGHRFSILVQAINGSSKAEETIKMFDLASANRSKERAKDALSESDAAHLHGRFKRLFEGVVFSPLPRSIVLKLRP